MADGLARVNNFQFIIQVCKGILRSHRVRRTVMFYLLVFVMVQVFAGSTFLWKWLRETPWIFLAYWGACAWLTMAALLLALYDMAQVRLEARRAHQRLKKEILKAEESDSPHDSHPT